jgi:hypothetical protein
MTTDEIESAIEHAINALGLAKLALSKSSIPVFNERDILRKADLTDTLPRASLAADAATKALAALADLERRATAIEGAHDMDLQTARKSYTIIGGAR